MVVLFCALDPTPHYCTFILSLCGWVMLGGLGVSVWAYMCVCVCVHIHNTLAGALLLLSIHTHTKIGPSQSVELGYLLINMVVNEASPQ